MCELIGRVDADPDVLPRTENFGLDYIAFSAMCPSCPPDFLKLTYNCVKVLFRLNFQGLLRVLQNALTKEIEVIFPGL